MGRIERKWTALFRSLGFKTGLSVGLILLASYAVFIFLVLGVQERFYFARVTREADRFSTAVIGATRHGMLSNDPQATQSIVANLGTQPGISYVRIYNHEGITKFSSNPSEIGGQVDKKAEACFVCHSKDKPFGKVVTDLRSRVHHYKGHRVLGMITPIYNEPSCSTAQCHAHPKSHKVLGVLDLGMSLQGFDKHTRTLVTNVILLGIGTCAAVLLTIGLYLAFRVHKPVNRLRNAIKKVAAGDFSANVLVESNDEIGECARGFNIMRDQIRRRTQELIRSRWEFKNLFEQVPCFICVINKDFEIVQQNTLMTEMFKGGVGKHCYEVFKKIQTRCVDCHAEETLNSGAVSHKEHCGLTSTGEEVDYVSYTTPVLDEKGEVIYAMIVAVDITDRVRLANELQISRDFQTNLIENSIHGIVATDENGRVTIFNRAGENLFGYRAEEVIGTLDLAKYFPGQFCEVILAARTAKPIAEKRVIAQESFVYSATGEQIPVRFSGIILFENEKIIGCVGFYQDLRTFKRLEREKQASDRLAVVGQTVAGLAHGIKNILQGLEGGVFVVQTAIEDNDQPLLERGWTMVQKNIARVSDLVKDLLSYSKERPPEYEETDPNVLAEEVCALFDIRAQQKRIIIERKFDPEAGKAFKVFLDQRGIHTCLSNLLANAIDACEIDQLKKEHRICVRTEQGPEGNLIFEILDDGTGMDEETKHKIFSSFFSTKGSRGTGLGLLITSKIVMEHGGDIFFESAVGIGTTFTIKLPPSSAKASHTAA